MKARSARIAVDVAVALAHVLVVAATLGPDNGGFATSSVPGGLLVAVEIIATVFHVGYIIAYLTPAERDFWSDRNPYKWLEYAITATMATIAVLYTSPVCSTGLVVMLSVAGAVQQSQGFLLERSNTAGMVDAAYFLSAVVLQIGEFVTVGVSAVSDDRSVGLVVAIYILTYASFGVLAAVVRWFPERSVATPVISEIMYSTIGAVAKISIYLAEYIYLDQGISNNWLTALTAVVSVVSISLIVVMIVDKPGLWDAIVQK